MKHLWTFNLVLLFLGSVLIGVAMCIVLLYTRRPVELDSLPTPSFAVHTLSTGLMLTAYSFLLWLRDDEKSWVDPSSHP